MGQALITDRASNGGFPLPLEGEPVRVIAARHSSCGEATRVRIPGTLPARAVRRVHCMRCAEDFAADAVEDLGTAAEPPPRRPRRGAISRPRLPDPQLPPPEFDPSSRGWRFFSAGAAAALVVGGLVVIQGGDDSEPSSPDPSAPALQTPAGNESPPPSGGPGADEPVGVGPAKHTELVQGSSFHLVIPKGWEQIDPPSGATFAAVAPDTSADVTLWIREDAKLDFFDFVERSREQLTALTGRPARTVEQVLAPTPEETIVRLAADAPPGQPTYEVLLRAAGAYRYSMSSTVQPDAPRETLSAVELITNSLTPEAGG